ncbi:hypothetical protein Y032_0090g2381 [Ancylostoma ceylanicum]|uniref:Uncharacterized protein n=1 Tax=Ancylostoma ceylanicum TaxID=53326 RepID=A0A016TMV9_9BILA|nr:hypothetical protein Y032_0090g2381 [Ancylostoma ceylanicum]
MKISSYGKFPLIDRTWDAEAFDLTKLLAYFNKNRTVTYALVPHISENVFNVSHGLIEFSTYGSTISKVAVSDNKLHHNALVSSLLRMGEAGSAIKGERWNGRNESKGISACSQQDAKSGFKAL